MAAFLSQSLILSPTLKAMVHHHEEAKAVIGEKQGITTILGSEPTKPTSSLRRTLSADMSSKKWLSQNGWVSKKNALAHIADSSSSEEEDDGEDSYEGKRKESWDLEKSSQFDIWSSIISQKREDPSVQAPPPYVHPLVRRSSSSLSEKSLEICTESLGSETGSDRFSSYQASVMSDLPDEDDKESDLMFQDLAKLQSPQEDQDQQLHFTKNSNYAGMGKKRQQLKSFPPSLPSLSRSDGALLRMQPRRYNGRFILEAISVYSEKNFCARRQDGRLVLAFNVKDDFEHVNDDKEAVGEEGKKEQEEALELDEEFSGYGESNEKEEEEGEDEEMVEVEKEEEAKKLIFGIEDAPPDIPASGDVNNVHKIPAMMDKKPMDLAKRNPTWPNKLSEVVIFRGSEINEEDEPILLPQSLPPLAQVARVITDPPPPSAAASFNAYEYFWRTKSTVPSAATTAIINPISSAQQQPLALKSYSNKSIIKKRFVSNDQQHKEQGADFWASGIKSCKEGRRSRLFWEPYCIATS